MTSLTPPTWHPALLVVAGVCVVVVVLAVRSHGDGLRARHGALAVGAIALCVLCCGWPLGDLAASVSLTALTVQRLVLVLAVAPMLLAAVPDELAARITRPRAVDATLSQVARPLPALVIVTVVGTLTLVPGAVDWGAHNPWARALLVVTTLVIGIVMWLPVMGTVPGARRLRQVSRAAYCFVAALVVTSLSIIWIIARHPLYPALSGQQALLHLSPLTDQQLAGFIAKLGAYLPMWLVAFVLFMKIDTTVDDDAATLRWIDVQREFERAERRGPASIGES